MILNSSGTDFELEIFPNEKIYSDLFQNPVSNILKSYRTNPEDVLILVRWKSVRNQSKSIPFIPVEFEASIQIIQNQFFSPN